MMFIILIMTLMNATTQNEPGLVAHYTFDEGSGAVLRDVSGNGNDGTIHGARFVPCGGGFCLEFDGVDDFVDCGGKPSLDLRDAVTLEAWVFPAARVKGEAGIVGKHFDSYLLSFYADGQCWWYISSGGNNTKHLLTTGSWHHVVGTFDGKTLKLYVDGKLVSTNPSKFDTIRPGRNFFIGCASSRTAYFPGMIDEVRVYNRALSEEEVRRHFEEGVQQLELTAKYQAVTAVQSVRAGGITLKVGRRGQVEVDTGNGSYAVESFYSYAGQAIGWNVLSESAEGSESLWRPRVRKVSTNRIEVVAQGRSYRLRRQVQLQHGRIEFEEELTNLRDEPIGFIVRHHLTAPQRFTNTLTPGGAENPTIFVAGEKECLGLLVEDNLSRLRFEPSTGLPDNQVRFKVGDFALDKRRRYTLRWRLYPLPKDAHYFDFINRIRREWHTNFTIEGPFAFFDVGSMRELLEHPDQLRAYLRRKRLGVV
ncbi:MAG: LamG domain-containing protein, partial [Abditibacteriales bacterium]|nr:LamG domain-containing protein [Abditibacteriales bacterium]MDW8368452.1 LamG domain-containing protein [Abditibacteriales bacterium]